MFNRNKENTVVPDVQLNLLRNEKLQPSRRQHGVNVLVLDSAHSWIICFANFIIMTLGSAFGRTISMTFLDFVEDFQVSITDASLGYTLQLVCFSLSCVSTGTTAVASIALISRYFDKRKSFATAVATSGLALGSMGAPPVVKLFMEMYGRHGTFLLLGALEMNNICMSMLLRPTTRYTSIIPSEPPDTSAHTTNDIIIPDPLCEQDKTQQTHTQGSNVCCDKQATGVIIGDINIELLDIKQMMSSQLSETVDTEIPPFINNGNENENGANSLNTKLKHAHELKTDRANHFSSSDRYELTPEIQNQQKDFSESAKTFIPLIPNEINGQAQSIEAFLYSSLGLAEGRVSSILERLNSYDCNSHQIDRLNSYDYGSHQIDRLNSYDYSSHQIDRLNSTDCSSHQKHQQMGSKLSKLNVSSTWSVISAPASDVFVGLDFCALQESSATCDEDQIGTLNKSCFSRFLKWLHGAFNIHLFRTWSLRALLLYNMTGVLVLYLSTYFPTIGARSGLTNDDIALMLIISGGVDFVSRLSFGAFSDLHLLSNTQIVAVAQVIIGTASHFTHFYTSFEALMVLSVILGVSGGVRQTFGTLICLQFMGAEKYVQALGFQTMTATLSMAVHHPLLSSILEVSGSFNPTLHYVGVAAYLSAIILLLEPYIKRMDAARENVKQTK
ncbi:hypothetical protein Btru_048401 [Bulinus truncatus]|nr:hypothetical protein Btru_048401 [Bulinus truncatus]